ncbi:MAG: 4Fe-4S dicluster domain-containing protein [Actinomycetota bacterium]
MGHNHNGNGVYGRLQQRLDRMPTGAPDSPVFQAILRHLFSPEEAELAAQMPSLISLSALASRVGRDEAELDAMITSMAARGLVLDLTRGRTRFVSLAPVVIGFYEFTFMRARDDAPMDELAKLFDEYLFQDPDFALARSIFQGSTQVGRALVREETVPDEGTSEVLDWERATRIVSSASSVAVSLCPCRHHEQLLGRGCDAPLRTCMSFGQGAEALIRAGIAEWVTNAEGLGILEECKQAGLAQIADNVREGISYICNCCGCCCGMMSAIRDAKIPGAIVSSNWTAAIDHEKCRGCKKCARACPADAITIVDNQGKGLRKYWAVLDADVCIGCGVCHEVCRYEGHAMLPRARRVFTPANTFDRMVAMAVERGKLGDLLVDTVAGAGPQAMARALQIIERMPPARAVRAIAPLRSVYLRAFLAASHAALPKGNGVRSVANGSTSKTPAGATQEGQS